MGLRRGFIQAGAQNLLMTLWPISDEVTVQIMSDFYTFTTLDEKDVSQKKLRRRRMIVPGELRG